MSQVLAFDQVYVFICYNCNKSDHIARRCFAFRKMNLKSFVKKIKKNTFDQEIESKKK
jgi:hypothetical protein